MKRTLSFLIALIVIITAMGTVSASADQVIPRPEWYVTYEANGTMGGNLGNQQSAENASYRVNDKIANMEPGDEETFYIRITNNYASPVRWFMKNIVDRTLEESGYTQTNGGAYSYRLTYSRFDVSRNMKTGQEYELFNSDRVGENNISGREGLKEATYNLENWNFLDTLNKGESGVVTLYVKYEGETQGNVYQNTISDISLQFAVETTNSNPRRSAVKTGDENNLTPYYIGMVAAGLLFLYFALDAYTDKLYKKKKG